MKNHDAKLLFFYIKLLYEKLNNIFMTIIYVNSARNDKNRPDFFIHLRIIQ